jgi:hypothetical protein
MNLSAQSGTAATWKAIGQRHVVAAMALIVLAALVVTAAAYLAGRDGSSARAQSGTTTIGDRAAPPSTYYVVATHEEAGMLEAFGASEFATVLVEEPGGASAILETLSKANFILLGQGLAGYKVVDLR